MYAGEVGNPPSFHVSKHHLEGSLADVQVEKILASCHRHLVTGLVRVNAGGKTGTIELRAGVVDQASFDGATGNLALARMHALYDGTYEVVQRLPDLAGELGGAASAEGEVSGVPLIKAMQHCESNALTCVIIVVAGFDRALIKYRLGEVVGIEKNGVADDDAIVEILKWQDARFRIEAPPLQLDIEGSPKAKADPTRPFVLHEDKDKAEGKAEAEAEAETEARAEAKAKAEEGARAEEPAEEVPEPATPSEPVDLREARSPAPASRGWWLVSVLVVLLAVAAAAIGVWLSWHDRGLAPAPRPAPVGPAPTPVDAAPPIDAPAPLDGAPAAPLDAAPVAPRDAN